MNKEKNVIRYYVLCNKLKDVIRTGWKNWHVKRDRLESVAEHIYGVQMLAIAMYSEYNYDIDLKKVIMMLAIHELEEIIIGDYTYYQITKEEKNKIGHEAIEKVLKDLINKEEIKKLILEFDERKTKEAIFAYQCDKLECDLQCKLYDEEHCVTMNSQVYDKILTDKEKKELSDLKLSWSEIWLKIDREKYHYDKNFLAISNYALNNEINIFKDE